MDRYRIAPARPVCLSSAGPGGHLRPAAPCGPAAGQRRSGGGGAEIGIFTAERYFSAADVVRRDGAVLRPALPDHHEPPPLTAPRMLGAGSDVAASQSGRTAASSEASWNSRSGLLSGGHAHTSASRMKGSFGGTAGDARGHDWYSGGSRKSTSSGPRWTLFGRDCPCAGRKAVTVDVATSEPRSPADARFSAQSAVEECLSAIVKAKTPSPSRPPVISDEEDPSKMKVTVTPGSRAFPLVVPNDVLNVAAVAPNRGAAVPSEAFAAAIGRRAGGFTFRAALGAARFDLDDEPPRSSLEVFRPIDEDSVMLADPPPRSTLSAASSGRVLEARDLVLRAPAVVDEEAMSDASSDLFDLESFAASSSHPTTYRGRGGSRRNSNDDDLPYAAEPALSECMYAPSEASVVWSVATAEGGAFDAASLANFSSAASACGGGVEEFRFVVPESPAEFTAAMSRSAAGRKKGSGGGGFLNSCRCEKAVSVGPTPVQMVKPPAYPAAAAAKKGSGSAARCHPGRVHVPVRT